MAIAGAPLRFGWAVVLSGTEWMNGRSIASGERLCEQTFCVNASLLLLDFEQIVGLACDSCMAQLRDAIDSSQSRKSKAGHSGAA
jgi:hypothetical protein